nr:hypothetical protein [Mycobacterium tuberculosis]
MAFDAYMPVMLAVMEIPGCAGRFEGSRDDRPLLGYDTPTGLTCPYTTPLDVT